MGKVEIDFKWGEVHKYYTLPYEMFYDALELPGIYVWHLRIKDEQQISSFKLFFNQLDLDVEVNSKNRLKYMGKLSKEIKDSSFAQNFEIFKSAMICIDYPLYIGISRNIKDRINKHKEQFEKCIAENEKIKLYHNKNLPGNDSEEESSYFGRRLASIWPDNLNKNSLYIKYFTPCVYRDLCASKNNCKNCKCKDDIYNELERCEYFFNSLFNPVFGRK